MHRVATRACKARGGEWVEQAAAAARAHREPGAVDGVDGGDDLEHVRPERILVERHALLQVGLLERERVRVEGLHEVAVGVALVM